MELNTVEKNFDEYYQSLNKKKKNYLSYIFILVILLILTLTIALFVKTKNYSKEVEDYKIKLDQSYQNYYLATLENANLEKKIQALNLKLAETINNTVALETMITNMENEKVNLEQIKKELEKGIQRTKAQLNTMQNSVNNLIMQREKTIIQKQTNILGKGEGKLKN